MQYEKNVDESRRNLRLALDLIGKYGLPTDPLNYSIWYEYASGKNEALNDEINYYLDGMDAFSAEMSRKIYSKFIAGKTEVLNDLVQDGLKKIFSEIISSINATNKQYNGADDHLKTINQLLIPNLAQSKVEIFVNQIKHEITKLESTNSSFKEQLDQATNEIDQLKTKMEQYRQEAIKDPLTRIDNRRGFDQKLQEAIDKANEEDTSLCLIIADIDHFKKINDSHGHLVGDNLLRMVAGTLSNCVKGRDVVARIGGEEFAFILPATPLDGAVKLADDMRITFDKYDLKKKNSGESLGKVTLSFGVTRYRHREESEVFVNRADEALYQSKNTGRNRVTSL